ncbi:MAG: hypothetical protein K8S99_00395 [Planctomycetes bacterium]|nr:hypothetical protein [Planctomycetota bacterium]
MRCTRLIMFVLAIFTFTSPSLAADVPTKAPFSYVWAKAYHIPSETTTDESGYFSLCEGLDGRMYVGTAAYGRNAYLVEFEPKTEKMRIVIDAHKSLGLPLTPTGYAAQAKFHTRNFVGPSGVIYLGTKQGYPTDIDKKNNVTYPGGYFFTYDPKAGAAVSHGQPMPQGARTKELGYPDGEGIIDTVADEARGLVYIVTCEHQHWFTYDLKAKTYRELDPSLRLAFYSTTLIDSHGRANAITQDGQLARYDPGTGTVTRQTMIVHTGDTHDRFEKSRMAGPLTWVMTPDGKTAYLIAMSKPNLYRIDLSGPADTESTVKMEDLGPVLGGTGHDSRSALTIAPDGRVYCIMRVDNTTGFGAGYLHHLTRYDPHQKKMEDLGVLAVKNPDFYGLPLNKGAAIDPETKKPRPWTHGYHELPDGTLTPLHAHMALVAARDGSLYATILYPYTLLHFDAPK